MARAVSRGEGEEVVKGQLSRTMVAFDLFPSSPPTPDGSILSKPVTQQTSVTVRTPLVTLELGFHKNWNE